MTLTIEDIRGLARLCKLKISNEEAAEMLVELNQILGYVEQLTSVDVSGYSPTTQVTGLRNVMRPDTISDLGANSDTLLMNAPSQKDGYIQVKKVL